MRCNMRQERSLSGGTVKRCQSCGLTTAQIQQRDPATLRNGKRCVDAAKGPAQRVELGGQDRMNRGGLRRVR